MARDTLLEIISGIDRRFLTEKEEKYRFYKDDGDDEALEVSAKDEKEADEKIEKIAKRRPDKVTKWKVAEAQVAEPEQGDCIVSKGPGGFTVECGGESLGEYRDEDSAWAMVKAWIAQTSQYDSNIWFDDGRGGYSQVDEDGNPIEVEVEDELSEANYTSNLDGGLGQPRVPQAFQRNNPTAADKRKERENAMASSWNMYQKPGGQEYTRKLSEMYERVDKLVTEINSINEAGASDITLKMMGDSILVVLETEKANEKLKYIWHDILNDKDRRGNYIVKFPKKFEEKVKKFLSGRDLTYQVIRIENVNEVKYSDWKSDDTNTPVQKVNLAIKEVNNKLYEIEKTLNRAMKLKTEVGMEQDAFWKSSVKKFNKISERMLRIGNKLREFNK